MSINTVPTTALDYTEFLPALNKQLQGSDWSVTVYPDGGGGNNKASFCTTGVHIIFTKPGDSVTGLPSLYVAHNGYVTHRPQEPHQIAITANIYGALPGTNDVGELVALLKSLQLIADLVDQGVCFNHITIYQDATYVINTYNDWMHNWARNNWRRRTGEPVANVEIVKKLMEVKNRLKLKTQKVDLKWVKGHSGNYGNTKADAISTVSYTFPSEKATGSGIFKYDLMLNNVEDKAPVMDSISPAELKTTLTAVPTAEGVVNPFLRQTAYYFMTGQYNNTAAIEKKYMMATLFKDSTFGERHPQNGYSLIVSKDRSLVLDTVEKHVNSVNVPGQICQVILKNIFTSKVHAKLIATREFNFQKQLSANAICNNLTFEGQPLATIFNPPLRAVVTFPYFNVLDNLLTQFRNGGFNISPDVFVNDVTDQFFTIDTSKKKPECKVVSHFTTAEKIFSVKIKPTREATKEIVLPMYVGSDIPIRNIIGALSKLNPKVSVLTVKEGDDAIRYFTIFEASCGVGIFGSLHSNFVKV